MSFIHAGADAITTNSYSLVPSVLNVAGVGHHMRRYLEIACCLADEARHEAGKPDIILAGAMPPLQASYRPDLVGSFEETFPVYERIAGILNRHVDVFVCETLSTVNEAKSAALAASKHDKPIWISWTLQDDKVLELLEPKLRSGEPLQDAIDAVLDIPNVAGLMVNCCSTESVDAAMPMLVEAAEKKGIKAGAYANSFAAKLQTRDQHGADDSNFGYRQVA